MHVYDDCSAVHASIGEEKADIIELRHQSANEGDVAQGYACNVDLLYFYYHNLYSDHSLTLRIAKPFAIWCLIYIERYI
jgi:hypothetical protein